MAFGPAGREGSEMAAGVSIDSSHPGVHIAERLPVFRETEDKR